MSQTTTLKRPESEVDPKREGIHDKIAECARKTGAATLHSISDIARCQRLNDNDRESVSPHDMLAELHGDNAHLTRFLSGAHEVCAGHDDAATTSLIDCLDRSDQAENMVPR